MSHIVDLTHPITAGMPVYPGTALGNKLLQAGQLIKSNLPVEVICLDSDGWDHHENLPNYIDQSLAELAQSLSAFYTDMGTRMQSVTVLVHTEFGRRVEENGSAGTDHGTAGPMLLLGDANFDAHLLAVGDDRRILQPVQAGGAVAANVIPDEILVSLAGEHVDFVLLAPHLGLEAGHPEHAGCVAGAGQVLD